MSSVRFASLKINMKYNTLPHLKINTKIVKYIPRKGGIRKRRRKDEE